MNKSLILWFGIGASLLSCKKSTEENPQNVFSPDAQEEYSGGDFTVFDESENAFGLQGSTLTESQSLDFFVGNSLFNKNWVTAPASTTARDGLGPQFNQRACSGCHFKDGRGKPLEIKGALTEGMLLRLSVPGEDDNGGPLGDPIYGGQLQDQAILGVDKEGEFEVTYTEISGKYSDGTSYSLRKPNYIISGLNYGALSANVLVSPRIGQQIYGLGLLEAVDEGTLLEYEDPSDIDDDGVSGRANYVWNQLENKKTLGRFGWKANQPNLHQQTAGAFLGDMGITSALNPDEPCSGGLDCDEIPNGGDNEIDAKDLAQVVLYVQTLAVPARRKWEDQSILQGKALFSSIGCESCHRQSMKTGNSHEIDALRNQTIRPYTDLLLHDMGDDLADNRPDFEADGNEWRTPPLWGIGLVSTVNGHTFFLHDGRARSLEEAILWHGGEAINAQQKFKELSKEDRALVLEFLNSL